MSRIYKNITAAILCGGKSTRLGREKAFAPINNIPLIEHVLNKLRKFFPYIIISGNNPVLFEKYKLPVITDIVKEKDAIGGIYSVLHYIKTEYAFIVACDMPFININVIKILSDNIDGNDIVIPKINGRFQPLFAIYSKNTLKSIEETIDNNKLKITNILSKNRTKILTEKNFETIENFRKSFFNVNSEKDYEMALNNKFKNTPLIAIVAKYSDSGKTTLITNLIKYFKRDNFKIAVIKDTFHRLDFDKKGKDSYKFYEAGADTVAVNSEREIIIRKKLSGKFPIKYIKDKFLDDNDYIIMEGHKTGNFTKIELTKDGQENFLFENDPNIVAVISNENIQCNLPQFKHKDYEKIYQFIKNIC